MNLKNFFLENPDVTQAEMADAVDASPAFVNQWVNGHRPVPDKYALAIEKFTGNKVSRKELCADWEAYWPEKEAA